MGTTSEFEKRWPTLSPKLRALLQTQTRPSVSWETKERNACYLTGYLGALIDTKQMDSDTYGWALALVNTIHKFDHIADLVRQHKDI